MSSISKDISLHYAASKSNLDELKKQRVQLISHVPTQGMTTTLFLNMVQPLAPVQTICPVYNKIAAPTISTYHNIGSNNSIIRLDPTALEHIPQKIKDRLGDLELDLFHITLEGSNVFRHADRDYINLCMHPWAFHYEQPGVEKAFDVDMGVFPEFGVEKTSMPGSIAFDSLSPMRVHAHLIGTQSMYYSPDNAHFKTTKGPFAVYWAVARRENRAVVAKMVHFYKEYPLGAILDRMSRCSNLADYLSHLPILEAEIDKTLSNIEALPPSFQNQIFKATWMHFNSPQGIHNDFGRASFCADPSLDPQYHCKPSQRAAILEAFAKSLKTILVGSTNDLLLRSQTLRKSDTALKMMRAADRILQKEVYPPQNALEGFSAEEKSLVEQALSEVRNDGILKAREIAAWTQALSLAASRQNKLPPIPQIEPRPPLNNYYQTLQEMISDGNFTPLNNQERAKKANALLRQHFPEDKRNALYGQVYNDSTDPQKGGPKWGEEHVADNLEILANICLDQA